DSMKRNIFLLALFLGLAAILITLMSFMLRKKENPYELTLYGNVDVRQVDIGFRVAGQVTELMFEEGDRVAQGTLMTTLDKTPYDSQLREAMAHMEAVKVNLENAETLLRRREELIGVGGVSQEDLDNARTNRDQLVANFVQAQAAVVVAQDKMKYTEAYAPTDGVILTRIREPGTVVNPADPVYTLSVSSPVWIRAFVDEPHLGQVYYGMAAEVYTDIEKGPAYTGAVGFISPVAEFTPKTVETAQLRTDLVYRLRIYADNPDRGLVQGMPVTVKLKLKKRHARRD
ncbi:MAG: efflux RND transporter periplasmic adaptor subunit, partial [Rhabdochlamydiaceae bacterium]